MKPPAGRLILALLLVVAGLAGCTSIPRSGPVVAGPLINNDDPRDGVLQAILEAPVPGQTPEQVVRGFINAAVGFGDDHRIARSFLAPSRRLIWSPDTSVDVYPNQKALTITSVERGPSGTVSASKAPASKVPASKVPAGKVPAGKAPASKVPASTPRPSPSARATQADVTVTTALSGSVDQAGRYSVASPGDRTTRTFGLVRSEGDWRIATLDDGIMVSSSDFTVTFRPFPVYFADPAARYLVPDVHWFPANSDITGVREVPTALVHALLEGPSAYLRGAVISGAPPGTQMAVAAVVVSDQVATVDLTEQVRGIAPKRKQLLLSQLRATLSIGAISAVQITVRRSPLDIPDEPQPGNRNDPAAADADSAVPGQPQADPQVDDEPIVIGAKGALARLSGRDLVPVEGISGLAVPGANRPAVSADQSAYAVLTGDRSRLLLQLPGAKASALVRGTMLTGPSFDPWGWVWTADRANPGWVSAARPEPGRVKVSAPWLKGKSVITLRISREGARALVAVEYRGHAHIFVSGVTRDGNGEPLALTQPLGLIPDLQTVVDVSWVDEDQVVALGHRDGLEGEQPWVAQIGGQVKATIPIQGAQSVSAANGELGLMVGTAQGTLTKIGLDWSQISTARWAAFPG